MSAYWCKENKASFFFFLKSMTLPWYKHNFRETFHPNSPTSSRWCSSCSLARGNYSNIMMPKYNTLINSWLPCAVPTRKFCESVSVNNAVIDHWAEKNLSGCKTLWKNMAINKIRCRTWEWNIWEFTFIVTDIMTQSLNSQTLWLLITSTK